MEGADAAISRIDAISDLSSSHVFADACQKERDLFDQNQEPENARKMQWELEACRLYPDTAHSGVKQTTYGPLVTYEDGTVWPDTKAFSDTQWSYLSSRATNSSNDFVRAHYSDISWHCKRDFRSAKTAITSFLSLEQAHWQHAGMV